ncbi:MAG TPA: CoA ester lyase [Burkholderiales bacterium]|nr:CoA ester lyase [Burkholderiales bacterium]
MKTDASRELPVWRSLLSVPVNIDKFVDRAHTRGADCVQLDLEDSIPAHEKASARKLVEQATVKVSRGGGDISVRVNCPIELAVRDIEHAVSPLVNAIAVTKVDSASHLRILDELVSRLEEKRDMQVGTTRFIALVETADAFFRLHEIAHATDRTAALILGSEDISLACNWVPCQETLLYPKQQMIIAANSAGIMPLGFMDTVAGVSDWEAFRRMVRHSRMFGFMGAPCIHPQQVAIVNEEYKPTAEEVEYARKVVTLDEQAAASGRGSFRLDGKMIDVPIVVRARRLLARHAKIVEREKRTLAAAKP